MKRLMLYALLSLSAALQASAGNVDSERDAVRLNPAFDADASVIVVDVDSRVGSYKLYGDVFEGESEPLSPFDRIAEPDLNFDGNADLTIYSGHRKGDNAAVYDAFLWDAKSHRFVVVADYSNIGNPVVNGRQFCVTSKVVHGNATVFEQKYEWDGVRMNLVESSSYGIEAEIDDSPNIADDGSAEVGAFITDNKGAYTNVRNKPRGAVVGKIPTNREVMLSLCNPTDGWWQIVGDQAFYAEDDEIITFSGSSTGYWVHHSVVGISTRNYGSRRIGLRRLPDDTSEVTFWFADETLVHPLDVRGDWVKVVMSDGKHIGWIDSFWLCDNPLTTCP